MALFTCILEYHGGTYIRQVSAPSLESAVKNWVRVFGQEPIPGGPNARARRRIGKGILSDAPVALNGLIHAWRMSGSVARKLALLTIIQTEP